MLTKKKIKYYTVKYFQYEREYTYKSILDLDSNEFVVVPTIKGNTVAIIVKRVKKPSFVCKSILDKIDLDSF